MKKRTYIYIDGFNFYYRAVKNTPYKWLDFAKLFSLLLPAAQHEIIKIKYFTARVQPRPRDKESPIRQDVYLRALKAYIPNIEIIYGQFLSHVAKRPLAPPQHGYATIIHTEEKGTDVNLAVHLLNDAWLDLYDCGVVVSNDSDLAESMVLSKQREKLIGWLLPGDQYPSQELAKIASFRKTIRNSVLKTSQLPVQIPNTNIVKPSTW